MSRKWRAQAVHLFFILQSRPSFCLASILNSKKLIFCQDFLIIIEKITNTTFILNNISTFVYRFLIRMKSLLNDTYLNNAELYSPVSFDIYNFRFNNRLALRVRRPLKP